MVNPQVSLLNLTLETDIPGDVMWSLIDCKHIVCRTMTDYLWIGLMIAWMKRLMEKQRILFDGREDNTVKENGGAEVYIIMSRPKCGF